MDVFAVLCHERIKISKPMRLLLRMLLLILITSSQANLRKWTRFIIDLITLQFEYLQYDRIVSSLVIPFQPTKCNVIWTEAARRSFSIDGSVCFSHADCGKALQGFWLPSEWQLLRQKQRWWDTSQMGLGLQSQSSLCRIGKGILRICTPIQSDQDCLAQLKPNVLSKFLAKL